LRNSQILTATDFNSSQPDIGVTRGAQFPGRQITTGAPNDCVGRRKVPTISQVLCLIQYILFRKNSGSNMGAPNSLLDPGAISPRYASAASF